VLRLVHIILGTRIELPWFNSPSAE
jgi:hypothetical protein